MRLPTAEAVCRVIEQPVQIRLMWPRLRSRHAAAEVDFKELCHASVVPLLAALCRSPERQTRYVMLVKVDGKDTRSVVDALIRNARKLPQELYKSLTWDRGKEMAAHKRFTMATDIQVFFCDPQSPWQRGSNENTNGLLRQYLPKGIDISVYSQHQLNAIARQLNERPRKTLGFQTPAEMFSESVASTR